MDDRNIITLPARRDAKPGQWDVSHAKALRNASVDIPAWNGVHKAKFEYLEVSRVTGRTQAYFAIKVNDRQGNAWKTVARCVVNGYAVVVDEYYPPVMLKR